MGIYSRFGERYHSWKGREFPPEVCDVCRSDLDIDPESGDRHCPVCESFDE